MPDQRGTLTLPQPAAAPPGRRGQVAYFDGALQVHDGMTWGRVGGGPTFGSVVVDVGALPTSEFTTTVDVPAATPGAFVQAWPAATAPGKDDDEVGMDVIDAWAYVPAAGKLTVRLTGLSGYLADQFTVNYLLRS